MPTQKKARARLHKEVDPALLQAPDFEKSPQQLHTKIDLGIELLKSAMAKGVCPFKPWRKRVVSEPKHSCRP
jgi:hypothetical protein